MSKLEDGYFYGDSNGNVRFVSYDSLGGGGLFFVLIILATIFLEKIGNFLMDKQWIILIPTVIAVLIRYFIYDRESSTKHKICNVASDALRTLGLYGVLVALFSKVLECHVLDRLLTALGLGLLFAAAYILINMICKFFRGRQWYIAHLITSIAVALISLMIYLNQVGIAKITTSSLSESDALIEDHITEMIYSIEQISGSYGGGFLNSDFFSIITTIFGIVIALLIPSILIVIVVAIMKKLDRETQAKFDTIGDELKKHLPNDANEYCVKYNGISYVDKHEKTYFLSFEELGYDSFPVEKKTVTLRYIVNMGKWLLKNIVADTKKYEVDFSQKGFGHFRLQTHEFIQRNTLKKW